jgi:hypothetical protein
VTVTFPVDKYRPFTYNSGRNLSFFALFSGKMTNFPLFCRETQVRNATVFVAIFSLLLCGCELLNSPLKDYIRKATGRTEGLNYEILTDHFMRADGTVAIPPADVSERTMINVFLSNKENYDLRITLEGEGSEYAGFTLSNNKRTAMVTLLNQPRTVDSVYAFDLTLNMTANGRPMPSIKLPQMECRYLDDTLAELSVSSPEDIEFFPPFNPNTTTYYVILPHETEAITLSGILPHFGTCLIQDTRQNWADDAPEFTHVIPVQDGVPYTVPITVTADSGKTNVYSLQIAWPGMITNPYSLILSVEDIIDAAARESFPAITIARSGEGQFYTVSVTGDYDSIRWEVDGVGASAGVTDDTGKREFRLDGSDVRYNTLGGHVLRLIVVKDGKTYQVNIPFRVVVRIFTDIDAFAAWLAAQPANTPATAYAVGLNTNDLTGIAGVLQSNDTKYVDIDLSGSTVTSIESSAFRECTNLTGVTIPNSVTSIGNDAFNECTSLTSITIPDSVTEIGQGAFHVCTSLTGITIPDSVTSIADSTFSYCTSLTSITIPNSVTEIGRRAFQGCYSLTGVTIPNNVANIEERAFWDCTKLTSVIIPDSVTSIGSAAFYNCTSLISVTIGNGVTSIGYGAFVSCNNLISVIFQGTIAAANFDSSAFSDIGDLREKYLAANGGIGTYTTTNPGNSAVWMKVN